MLKKTQAFSGDYRQLLVDELKERRSKNPSFSMRAFARVLGMSPALLSLLISGKANLTQKQALKIADKLELSPLERESLMRFMGAELLGRKVPGQSMEMAQNQFSLISDWYHFAVLTLGQLPGAKAKPAWIAQRLGIKETEAIDSLNQLEKMNLIKIKDGKYCQAEGGVNVWPPTPSAPIRKYHKQNLELAKTKIDEVDMSLREFNSIVMPANPAQLDKARRLIHDFKIQLNEIMEEGKHSEVYTLAIQLFPVTQPATQ